MPPVALMVAVYGGIEVPGAPGTVKLGIVVVVIDRAAGVPEPPEIPGIPEEPPLWSQPTAVHTTTVSNASSAAWVKYLIVVLLLARLFRNRHATIQAAPYRLVFEAPGLPGYDDATVGLRIMLGNRRSLWSGTGACDALH